MALREADSDLELAKQILANDKSFSSSRSMLELKTEEKKDNLSIHSYEVIKFFRVEKILLDQFFTISDKSGDYMYMPNR